MELTKDQLENVKSLMSLLKEIQDSGLCNHPYLFSSGGDSGGGE